MTTSMNTSSSLDASFDTMPGFSAMFRDFIHRRDAVLNRFPANARLGGGSSTGSEADVGTFDDEYWRGIAAANTHRAVVASAIADSMVGIDLSAAQKANLELLAQATTLTVITGQQAGLFGGALYTVLKAWSAVQTARRLTGGSAASDTSSSALNGALNFVPVFWVEDNDHDLAEISTVGILDKQDDALELRIEWASAGANAHANADANEQPRTAPPDRTTVGDVVFNAAITDVLAQTKEALRDTEFTTELFALLNAEYAEGKPVAQAFTRLLNYLLRDTGILFVSAAALRKRGAFAVVVEREIERSSATEAALHAASQALLANGYHVQAQSSPLNLFHHDGSKRHKIARNADGTYAAGTHTFTHAELVELARSQPAAFSPNVLLRPVAQDSAFPNAAYIAGPGEVGYLAQTKELYAALDVAPAAVLPRHSATILDKRAAQVMEKQTAGFAQVLDFLVPYPDVEKRALAVLENKDIAAAFDATRASTEAAYSELMRVVAALDPTLAATVDKTKTQSLQGLDALAGKTRKAQKQAEEITIGKLRKTHALLFPLGGMQERTLTALMFVNRYGLAAFSEAMQTLTSHDADKHYFLTM
jgi:bacillithiol synthase